MKAVKTIAALIFVTALGIVLVQPVLGADDDPPEANRGPAVEEPAGSGPRRDHHGPPHPRLIARYPRRCLRPVDRRPSGLLAARRGSTALIGFPTQRPAARIEVSGDVAWSPSGRFLAERGGRVVDQSGNPQGSLFFQPVEWQWSPVADCALAVTERGNLTYSIPDTRRRGIRLLDAPVEDFELSPNGRRLAVDVGENGGLWIADLRRGRFVFGKLGHASLVGWFSNRAVLFSKSPGSGKLRYATGRGKPRIVHGASAGGTLVRCAKRVLLVSSEGPPLAELGSRRGRIHGRHFSGVAAPYDGYSDADCSPDSRFMVATAVRRSGEKGPLMLHDAEGALVRVLVAGRTANPEWSSDGLTFVKFGRAGRGRLWLIEPGSNPRPTAYRVGAPTQYDWHVR